MDELIGARTEWSIPIDELDPADDDVEMLRQMADVATRRVRHHRRSRRAEYARR